jgi:hypothetical protein
MLAALANRLGVIDAIFDGEMICADETGRSIFTEMLLGRHPVCFVAFDPLWPNSRDLRPLPLVELTARLMRLLRRRSNHLIAEALAIEGRGCALFDAVEEHIKEHILRARRQRLSDHYWRGVHWQEGVEPRLFAGGWAARVEPHRRRDPVRRATLQFGHTGLKTA